MTIAIIQARLTSTRLPNKVLMQLGKFTAIELMYNRVKRAKSLSNIVFAIPDNTANDRLANYIATTLKAPFVRGSEDDVLSRYVKAAAYYPSTSYARLTADCPLICPEIIDLVVNKGINDGLDYCSNTNPPTFPNGFDSEFFTGNVLKRLDALELPAYCREHVTVSLHRNQIPKLDIKTGNVEFSTGDFKDIRVTLDYPNDLEIIRIIVEKIGSTIIEATAEEIIQIYLENQIQAKLKQQRRSGTAGC